MGRRVSPWVTQSHRDPICSLQGEREARKGWERRGTTTKSLLKLQSARRKSKNLIFKLLGVLQNAEMRQKKKKKKKRKGIKSRINLSSQIWRNNDQGVWCYIIFLLPRCLTLSLDHPHMRGLHRILCELVILIQSLIKAPSHLRVAVILSKLTEYYRIKVCLQTLTV